MLEDENRDEQQEQPPTDEYQPRYSQEENGRDIVTEELTDKAHEDLGVSAEELRDGFDRTEGHGPEAQPLDDHEAAADDWSEAIEDKDQDGSEDRN